MPTGESWHSRRVALFERSLTRPTRLVGLVVSTNQEKAGDRKWRLNAPEVFLPSSGLAVSSRNAQPFLSSNINNQALACVVEDEREREREAAHALDNKSKSSTTTMIANTCIFSDHELASGAVHSQDSSALTRTKFSLLAVRTRRFQTCQIVISAHLAGAHVPLSPVPGPFRTSILEIRNHLPTKIDFRP